MASAGLAMGPTAHMNVKKQTSILREGDVIGLICPASGIDEDRWEKSKQRIEEIGLKPLMAKHVLQKTGYLAGIDQQRINDLHDMYKNPQVKAIWAIRGGYGTARLLPLLDFNLIKRNPKPLIGYSDLTVLLNVISQKTKSVNYHFTMPGTEFTAFGLAQIKHHLMQESKWEYPLDSDIMIQNNLKAIGRLLGGNLSVLVSLIGTQYEVNLDNSILFLEDVGEKPYRIDRMMNQMKQAGSFKKVKGLIIGKFEDCEGELLDSDKSLTDLIMSYFTEKPIPIISNAPIGHIDSQWLLPVGAKMEMDLFKAYLGRMR